MDAKHTPEPWVAKNWAIASDDPILGIRMVAWTANNKKSRSEKNAANAERIVACVNALAGIEDPAAFMMEAKHALLGKGAPGNRILCPECHGTGATAVPGGDEHDLMDCWRCKRKCWIDEPGDAEIAALRESHERLRAALLSIQTHGDDEHECGHTRQSACIGEMQSIARQALAAAPQ